MKTQTLQVLSSKPWGSEVCLEQTCLGSCRERNFQASALRIMRWGLRACFRSSIGASLVAQMVKNLPAMQETQFQSLSGKDPLEEGMATHSSILAWEIPWTEESDRLRSIRLQRVKRRLST